MTSANADPPTPRQLTERTLQHYEDNAPAFWQGTRDHDVSQNIEALLRHIQGLPPFTLLDLGCGPGRDLRSFTDRGHHAIGLEGSATLAEMGEVAKHATMPLATNMVTTEWGHVRETLDRDAVQVILSDHHYWGGLRATQQLAHLGRVFGLGISMHSNSHLGVSLAAMTHVGVTLPNLAYAADTHYPWQVDEVIVGGKLRFEGGSLAPPPGPGLGVTLDRAALAALHRNYETCGIRRRDDGMEMRKHVPGWNGKRPRF